jgi:toxin ParE1/3/4
VTLRVRVTPAAREDLTGISRSLAEHAPPERARTWVRHLRAHLTGFAILPERGTRRDDLRPGLRTVGYRRRVTIAFIVTDAEVVILRVLYAGRDIGAALREPD